MIDRFPAILPDPLLRRCLEVLQVLRIDGLRSAPSCRGRDGTLAQEALL